MRAEVHQGHSYMRLVDDLTKFRSPREQEFIDLLFAKLARGDIKSLENSLRNRTASGLRRRRVLIVERMQ